jgi:hypothetical protein
MAIDDSAYMELLKDLDKAGSAEDTSGIDAFLSDEPIKVASLADLVGFHRISDDALVHKAQRDLWRIAENDKGEVIIERLFDPTTNKAIRV